MSTPRFLLFLSSSHIAAAYCARGLRFVCFLLWLLSWGAADVASGGTVPQGFAETIVPGPVSGNWNGAEGVTFDSTGRMFVWEVSGRVWFKDPAESNFTLLLDISEEVGAWIDNGFNGFALDPNFRVNGYIYLLYTVDRHYLLYFGTPNYNPNANLYNNATIGRLTRYTCRSSDGFRSVDPASRLILIGATKETGFPILS